MRHALHCLTLLLLPGLAPEATLARPRQRPGLPTAGDWRAMESVPYLAAIGPPGLRFREPEPAPEPAVRPVAVGPPVPGLNMTEAVVAVANAAALQATTASRVSKVDDTKPGQASSLKSEPAPVVIAKPVPPTFQPDDTQPQVRAEDFLPFFQLPGAARPAPLPPSSATYTQTPK